MSFDMIPAVFTDAVGELDDFLHFAATIIQKRVRGYWRRKEYLRTVETRQREQAEAQSKERIAIVRQLAAATIQRCFRSFIDRRMFAYYQSLITLREKCDPKEVLRFINPREAELVDPAAAIHVRFRLGGASFPPLVFYKIFTHRPVLDLCAFCPRNYAGEALAPPGELWNRGDGRSALRRTAGARAHAAQRTTEQEQDFELPANLRTFVRPDGSEGLRDARGWYRRRDNNGWRPISEKVLLDGGDAAPGPRRAEPFFHFDAAQRRAERAQKHKERRRQWMVAMYRQGVTSETDPAQYDLLLRQGVLKNPEAMPDEELLAWCHGLDFDSYLEDWAATATSMGSEAFVPEDFAAGMLGIPAVSTHPVTWYKLPPPAGHVVAFQSGPRLDERGPSSVNVAS